MGETRSRNFNIDALKHKLSLSRFLSRRKHTPPPHFKDLFSEINLLQPSGYFTYRQV